MNELSANIFRSLCQENITNNFVFSPASYLEVIHALSLCANKNNLKEILDALHVSQDELFSYIQCFKSELQLDNYNILLCRDEYSKAINYEIVKKLKEISIEVQWFNNFHIDKLIQNINNLVNEKTHNRIQNILTREDVNNLLGFIMLNCVYFKKDWLYGFDFKKIAEPFYGTNETKLIIYLTQQKKYAFYEDSMLDIVEMPYKESNLCCYLLVPTNNNSLFNIINNIEENYDKIKQVKTDIDVSITCPSFETESTFDLNQATKNAGINEVFQWNKDWQIINFNTLKDEAVLSLTKIKQKVYIDFTRQGTEAAAATTGLICITGGFTGWTSPPRIKYIRADKPFLYILADKRNKDIPLFMGIVNQI